MNPYPIATTDDTNSPYDPWDPNFNQPPNTTSPNSPPSQEFNHSLPIQPSQPQPIPPQPLSPPPTRKSNRPRKPPSYLKEYHCSLTTTTKESHKYPLSQFISYDHLSPTHKHFSLALSTTSELASYHESIQHPAWQAAIESELAALHNNNTWTLTHLPPDKPLVSCKWLFKLKYHADGTVERHKARLVARGFTQTAGLDYLETFSPVVKMTTVRLLLALASSNNWFLHQLDVNTAFLHGDLLEDVYMQVPPGLEVSDPNLVCKLQKSLYGLKQASRQWNAKLTDTLIQSGYVQSKADYSLFTKKDSTSFTAILVYVDDLVLAGNDLTEIHAIKSLLDRKFSIKDIGELKYFLGFEVARSHLGISLYQRKYSLDLLQDTGLLGCKPSSTPMHPKIKIGKDIGTRLSNPSSYRRLIGKLLYLTHTRPDICYAVSRLSQFLETPTDIHQQAALRIIRYLKNAPGSGVFFPTESDHCLKGFTDSDWGACLDTRRSITGFYFFPWQCSNLMEE